VPVLVPAAVLAAILAAAPARAADPTEARREALARRVVAFALDLRREILAADAAAIAAHVPAEGLRCAGGMVPRDRVLRDLRAPRSWVHRNLFGDDAAGSGAPSSLRDFFRRAGEIEVAVVFERDEAAGPPGRACIRYRSRALVPPPVPLCAVELGGRLWLTESLYPCG
jgi:hypothetical protein